MKKLLLPLVLLLGGTALGGGAAYGTALLLGPPPEPGEEVEEKLGPSQVVTGGTLLAPLVFEDGRMAGYVSFDVELEVGSKDAERVASLRPLLAHEVNMRTFKVPLAAGPDGMIPDLYRLRQVVNEAATATFGEDVVRRTLITRAVPA